MKDSQTIRPAYPVSCIRLVDYSNIESNPLFFRLQPFRSGGLPVHGTQVKQARKAEPENEGEGWGRGREEEDFGS